MSALQNFLECLDADAASTHLQIFEVSMDTKFGDEMMTHTLNKVISFYDRDTGSTTDLENANKDHIQSILNYYNMSLYLTMFERKGMIKRLSGIFSFNKKEKCRFQVTFDAPPKNDAEYLLMALSYFNVIHVSFT